MIAYVTSIGEPTTDLCVWALQRNGFQVKLMNNKNSLASKLHDIYSYANEDFLRVDADVIVNRNCNPKEIKEILRIDYLKDAWWVQFQTWGWFNQDLIWGGVQYIKKEALPFLRDNVAEAANHNRPETYLTRIKEFYEPRRFESSNHPFGLHGYGIKDLKPIIKQKANRGQSANYDFELAQRLNEL